MKIRLFAAAAMALMLAACQQNPANTRNFTSEAGDFSINMPVTPSHKSNESKLANGEAIRFELYSALEEKKAAYIVAVIKYPDTLIKPGVEEIMLNGVSEQVKSKGSLLGERKIKLNGKYPGREITILSKGGKVAVRTRLYLVENRLYQIVVSAPKENIDNQANQAYLDSFLLNEK